MLALRFITFWLAALMSSGAYAIPNLFEVKLGKEFPLKSPHSELAIRHLPAYTFSVPNHGNSTEWFTQYELTMLSTSDEVVVVSAVKVFPDVASCETSLQSLTPIIADAFPGISATIKEARYEATAGEVRISVLCERPPLSPFTVLKYQARSNITDVKLKSDWDKYFATLRPK